MFIPVFATVKFREGDARTYTYVANEAFATGDRVLVEVKGEQKIVVIADFDVDPPSFACKGIIGMAPAKADDTEGGES